MNIFCYAKIRHMQRNTDITKTSKYFSLPVPHPPTHLEKSNVTNSSAVITWMYPEPSTGPITFYTVRWTSSRGNGSNDTGRRSYLVTKLFPYENYTFQVSASTKAGRGEWSKSILVQTDIGGKLSLSKYSFDFRNK